MAMAMDLCLHLQAMQRRDDTGEVAKAIEYMVAIQKSYDHIENQLRAAERQIAGFKSTETLMKRLLGCDE